MFCFSLVFGVLLSSASADHSQGKPLPPCALQVKCEEVGGSARCSIELLTPQLCEGRAAEVEIEWARIGTQILSGDPWPRTDSEPVGAELVRFLHLDSSVAQALVFEYPLDSSSHYRIGVTLREPASREVLGTACSFLVRAGDRYRSSRSHPMTQSAPVPMYRIRFDRARRW